MLFCLTKAIRHLKNEADWQEILAKVKEEEPLPSYLFKVKPETHEKYRFSLYSGERQSGEIRNEK